MVSYFGMSDKVGNKSFYDSSGQADFNFSKPYSEKTAELIDEEVNSMIEQEYERAKRILRDNMEGLVKLADQLLEKEVIFSEDLEKIFGPRPWAKKELAEKKSVPAKKPSQSKKKTAAKPGGTSQTAPKLGEKEVKEEPPRTKTA
jgi:cell division protease FtsH